MSDAALVGAMAAITIGSRVAALAVLPPPSGRGAEIVARLPAPLFAALAAVSVTGSDAGATDPALLGAVGAALVSTRWRSLLVTLAAGLAGYVVASTVAG